MWKHVPGGWPRGTSARPRGPGSRIRLGTAERPQEPPAWGPASLSRHSPAPVMLFPQQPVLARGSPPLPSAPLWHLLPGQLAPAWGRQVEEAVNTSAMSEGRAGAGPASSATLASTPPASPFCCCRGWGDRSRARAEQSQTCGLFPSLGAPALGLLRWKRQHRAVTRPVLRAFSHPQTPRFGREALVTVTCPPATRTRCWGSLETSSVSLGMMAQTAIRLKPAGPETKSRKEARVHGVFVWPGNQR